MISIKSKIESIVEDNTVCGDHYIEEVREEEIANQVVDLINKTGLQDSNGKEILFDQLIKVPVTINKEIHGNHSFYKVIRKGSIAVLSYVKSEKGQIVPKGYMSCLLTDKYRVEDLCLVNDISKLKPVEEIFIVKI